MLEREALLGRFAWVMAWVGLVAGQLHALARFSVPENAEDLDSALTAFWAEPAMDLFAPLLRWGDPDLVYVTYGKIWFPVFLAFTLFAFVVHRQRRPRGFERLAWWPALAGYVLGTASTFVDYWTQWTGQYNVLFDVGWLLTLPAFLLILFGSTLLGLTLLARGARPVLPFLLLALELPLAFLIVMITSMGSAALPVMFAFGLLGRRAVAARDGQKLTAGGVSWPAGAS